MTKMVLPDGLKQTINNNYISELSDYDTIYRK